MSKPNSANSIPAILGESFMLRALELADLGRGHVSPNPMVGCVITYEANGNVPRIIGEGWHERYGQWHAEVNAIRSVRPEDTHLLSEATVYVTLEPCSHWGKTPPCADLLIENCVRRVVCCNDDPNPLVAGQGFAKLRAAGIAVETGLLAKQGRDLNARFFTYFDHKRPYIILKWAETNDGFIAGDQGEPTQISGDLAHRLVHRWRSEEDAIMVGTNTARTDNPRLTTRLWPGKNPIRIVVDRNGTLPADLHVFDGSQPTLVYHQTDHVATSAHPNVIHVRLEAGGTPRNDGFGLTALVQDLYDRKIQSVLVEGGTRLLDSFIGSGLWDEMRVFRSQNMLNKGIKAPGVQGRIRSRDQVGTDELTIYTKL